MWVYEKNPSIILGHNVYGFDFPYLQYVMRMHSVAFCLGRNGSEVKFAQRSTQFRKDGSQSYDYNNVLIYGREIVDTMFLSMKYDGANRREYESYGLKAIIKHEGLERKVRQHYEAGHIGKNWNNLEERKKIKAYAIDDADDALKLYDLMIPSFFYYTQAIPRSLQHIINSATGSQINSWMVRSYLQQGHSIAKGSNKEEFPGAISFGNPGIHKNVFKVDVQSLYPSIILSSRLYNKYKDPQANFLKFMDFFTKQRILDKEQFEKTGDRLLEDLSNSRKININSGYGFLSAPKLNYNSPSDAARVTAIGREILKKAIKYASGKEYIPVMEDEGDDDAA
jgi:DNA polymerase elongation subunit (family B)